jgi:hypothetical protein
MSIAVAVSRLAPPGPPVAPPQQDASPAIAVVPQGHVDQLSTGDLRAQVQLLTGQMAGLNAERSGLMAQLRAGPVGDRAATISELDRVNHQFAIATGQLANAKAQLALRESVQGTQNPGMRVPRPMDPDVLAGLAFAFIFAVMMPIAIAYSRRIWRGKPTPPAPRFDPTVDARLEHLEQAVDAIAIEIERVSEGQRFVTKVLTERMPVAKPATAALEESPLRALGAGPLEPIRAPERQAVRQSITPH